MINITNFDPNLLKIDKKSYKGIDIYCTGYITKKDFDHESINSVNPLYFIVDEVDGSVEEKYIELWNKIKILIETVDNKPGEYGKDFVKIKFNSDDNLPLNKPLKLYMLTIIVRSVFEEDVWGIKDTI